VAQRFFRHGELHLVILSLLEARPMHGYELMGELKRLFAPRYRPSAGAIYPAVDSLEAEGLIQGQDHESRRVFTLTRTGRVAIDKRRPLLADLEVRTGVRLSASDGTDAALARFSTRVRAAANGIELDELNELLEELAEHIEALADEG
jgi:DNA-binding PadR family transcriptional regulator